MDQLISTKSACKLQRKSGSVYPGCLMIPCFDPGYGVGICIGGCGVMHIHKLPACSTFQVSSHFPKAVHCMCHSR